MASLSRAESVRRCLLCLVEGGRPPPAGVRALEGMARRAARSAADQVFSGEDLMQAFTERMLTRAKRLGGAVVATEWRRLPGEKLLCWVKQSLRNLAVEQNPGWDTQRALRQVVQAALQRALPTPKALPPSLERRGRFDRRLVAQACAVLVAGGVKAEAPSLTPALMAEYGLGACAHAGDDLDALAAESVSPEEAAGHRLGTAALVRAMKESLAPEAITALRDGAEALQVRDGLARATAYARVRRAVQAVAALVTTLGCDTAQALSALEHLRAAV